ncbi:MAG: SAM-dependent methyltransferase [Fimbriimonadales bacterium]|nr:SAM-dependent methyltransferase [Fimbriimonadales bacterium]
MRRAKPSGKPTTRVRQILTQLGYVEHEDFEYEVEVRLYGNRRLYADVMLFHGDTPIAVVEVEGKPSLLREGFEEARFKGAAWNLENPVPLLWVAAGERDALYRLTSPCNGICYTPIGEQPPAQALAPAQLAELIGDYLQRTDTRLGQTLRDRTLLRNALQAVSGKDPRTRFVNLLTTLRRSRMPRNAVLPLREAYQRLQQAREHETGDFALASALRSTARTYFRPVAKNDDVRRLGRYYTPDEVIELLVEIAEPQPDMRILDFACGSGGFLLGAARWLAERYSTPPQSIANCLHGMEIDRHAHALAALGLEIGVGASIPHLKHENALTFAWQEASYDLILCNPPAGTLQTAFDQSQFRYAGRGKGKLNQYEIAFAELAVRLAKPDALIALVVPEGLLSNASAEPFRRHLFGQARPIAVLGLPRGLFPHTPSRMYALILLKTPLRKGDHCLITELSRYDLTANRPAVVALIQEARHA